MPSGWDPLDEPKVVRVYYHTGVDQQGVPEFGEVDIAHIHSNLNTSFALSGFQFVYNDCSINYWSDPSTSKTGDICVPYGLLNHEDGLDIYLQSANLGGTLFGCTVGIPGDAVLVCNKYNGVYNGLNSTMPHEVGHALGLFHTHHHCEGGPFTNCAGVTQHYSGSGLQGDFVADTPLDKRYDYTEDPCVLNLATAVCNVNSTDIADIDNYMSYYWGCGSRFTTGQMHRMHTLVSPAILVNPGINTIELSVDQVFDRPAVVGTQVRIVNGAVVDINTDIVFDQESSIYVEAGSTLIVDGATLEACPDERWKGIHLDGGTIILKDATIERAQIGIENRSEGQVGPWWPGGPINTVDVAKGTIDAVGSTFLDCVTGIYVAPAYILPIAAQPQSSTIVNCFFDDCREGIELERSLGLTITGTEFINGGSSIVSESSGFTATGCHFYDQVDLLNTTPAISAPIIDDCDVYGNNIIVEHGLTLGDISIVRCNFFCAQTGDGVWMESYNAAAIRTNSFYDCFDSGVYMSNTGIGPADNRIQSNLFDGGRRGVEVADINDFEFLQNCFVGMSRRDIELNGGRVRDVHGDPSQDQSAGNCFSRYDEVDGSIGGSLNNPSTDVFRYLLEEDNFNTINCKNPQDASLYNREQVLEQTDEVCGDGGGGYIVPSTFCEILSCDSASVRVDSLLTLIEEIEGDTTLTDWYQRWLINRTKRCAAKILKKCSKDKVLDDKSDEAVELLSSQDEFRYQAMAYGILVQTGDLSAARDLLSEITATSGAEQDYIDVQGLYLDYLEQPSSELSEVDSVFLRTAALRRNVYSSAARGIYHRLTGERLRLPRKPLVEERSSFIPTSDPSLQVTLHPNPTQGLVYVDAHSDIASISVLDLQGVEVQASTDIVEESSATVTIAPSVANGLYLVVVATTDGAITASKLIVQR